MKNFVVAIDGPVAAGKGTLGRRLADYFGFAYLDTGALFRAVAMRMMRSGDAMEDVKSMVAQAQAIDQSDLEELELRTEATGMAASKIAPQIELRHALIDYQRKFANHPPGQAQGAILDGRDIGTVVCPDAEVKFFVTASSEARAVRRHAELIVREKDISLDTVRADLLRRDRLDSNRATSPLTLAEDAHLLDTTKMDIEAAFRAALDIVNTHKEISI